MPSDSNTGSLFHQRTLDYLNLLPVQNEETADSLRALELYVGVNLPPSVHEWFSYPNAAKLIRFNDDHVLDVDQFELKSNPLFNHHPKWQQGVIKPSQMMFITSPDKTLIDENLLVVIVENQGVYEWAVDLNGSDDPPVLMKQNEPNQAWKPCSPTFSDFVFARAWDTRVMFNELSLWGSTGKLTADDLTTIENWYDVLPVHCNLPQYERCFRFQRDEQCIFICQDDRDSRMFWHMTSKTSESLKVLLKQIGSIQDVLHRLEAFYDSSFAVAVLEQAIIEVDSSYGSSI